MEKTYNPALIQRTQRYMETHSISQNQFAAKVNLSSAALSSYLNQKYKGSVEAVERQLSEFFKLDEEAEAAAEKTASLLPRAAYVPTSISEDVCQSIRFAQLEHCMVVLHGDAGVGKSKGAQKFLHDHPTNAVGISITPSTGTLNGSIKLLARVLRVPECRNKMDQMMALRSRLDGTNWVIVIDEAQHLKYAALEEIRSLTDDNPMTVEHGVGVVLIGNSEVYSRLQGRQQAQFAQLFSRIRMQREYTTRKVKEDDVRNARASASIIRPTCKPLLHGSARSFWHRRSTSRKRSRRNTAMNIWARSSAAVRRYLKICGLSLSRKRLSETSIPLKTVLTGAGIPTRGRSTAATMMRHTKRCISSTN